MSGKISKLQKGSFIVKFVRYRINLKVTKTPLFLNILFFSCSILMANQAMAVATAQDIVLSVQQGKSITIDLTGSVGGTDSTKLTLSIVTAPTHGTAQVANGLSITYMPDPDYFGSDEFQYQVTDTTDSTTQSAKVTITILGNVNAVETAQPTANTPSAAIATTVDSICADTNNAQALLDRCNEFSAADSQELNNALKQIAPEEAATQSRVDNTIAVQQLGNIGKRLASLRRGTRGVSLGGLTFNVSGQMLPGTILEGILPNEMRGGAASADSPNVSSKLGLFLSGNMGIGNRDTTNNEDGFKFNTYGMTGGVDYRLTDQLIFGSALGYAKTDLNLDQNGGSLNVGGYSVTAYGTYYKSAKTYIDGVVTYNKQGYDSTRNIDYTIGGSTINRTAIADTNSHLLAASLGGGYEIFSTKGFTTTFLARLDYLKSNIGGYQETGAQEFDVAIDARKLQSTISSIGSQFTYAMSRSWGVVIPQLDFSWEHEFKGNAVLIRGNFIEDQSHTVFAFETDQPDRDYFRLGLGTTIVLPGGKNGFIQYETTLGKQNFTDHNIALGIRMEL